MHNNQNQQTEQGRLLNRRLVFKNPPEVRERFNTRAMLAALSAEIGIEAPMKAMLKLERGLTAEGQTAEYQFEAEKLTAIKEKDGVVWKNERGEVIQKAQWLKEKTSSKVL